METNNNKTVFLEKIIVRTASLPFETEWKDEVFYQHLYDNPSFMRALYHAHPLVFRKVGDWLNGKLQDPAKIQKLKHTLYNYYTRMFSNAVPYGFFSSVGVAYWGKDTTDIELAGFEPKVKLDMEVLGALTNYVHTVPLVKESVKYYPNNTLYQTGIQFRYLEMSIRNNKAGYKISAVEYSDFLAEVFVAAAGGITVPALAAVFAGENYTVEELSVFFYELVDSQLLVSELQLNITGPDPFTRLRLLVKELKEPGKTDIAMLIGRLDTIDDILQQLNRPEHDFNHLADQLAGMFNTIGVTFDERHLLQVDNFATFRTALLAENIQASIYDAVRAMSCFNQNDYKPFLEGFKTRFTEKYEDAWVPLMQAIDTEIGVSFGHFTFNDESLFTSEIDFTKKDKGYLTRNAEGDQVRRLLYKKYFNACLNGEYTVCLGKDDFKDLPDKIGQLAASFQVVFNVVNKKENLLVLRTAGNSSGGNLLSRFAYGSAGITGLLQDIGIAEQKIYDSAVLAEIVHLPDYRIGNITFRPVFREYEIPVLTQSVMPAASQIALDDLVVSVREGRIVLWSKRLNKRVIPMLTNAHNYGLNTSPVYQFLSELVYQDMVPSLYMDRGELSFLGSFNRRIQYENVILFPATWNFEKKDLQELIESITSPDADLVAAFRKKWSLPERTTYSDNSSNILIQWNSLLSVYHFLKAVQKKTDTVYLEEYLFDENSPLIRDAAGRSYYNEFITVINNTTRNNAIGVPQYNEETSRAIKQKFFPGEEWIYFKIYTGIRTGNKILRNELQETLSSLYAEGLIQKFFFIRYNDPEYHLRLRFLTNKEDVSKVIEVIHSSLAYYTENKFIWKMQIDTYMRELDRYGETTIDFSESVFEIDSNYFIGVMSLLEENYAELAPLFFIKGIDSLLSAFGFDLERKYNFIEKKKRSYEQEFNVRNNFALKSSLDKKEKEYRKVMEDFMEKAKPGATNETYELFRELIHKRELSIRELVSSKKQLLTAGLTESLANSFVHMHAIRMFQTNPRENELVGYYILYFYYHKHTRTKQKMAL